MSSSQAFELRASLDPPSIARATGTELRCYFKLPAPDAPEASKKRAAKTSICLVFDCSGSTAGRKREAAIEAAKMIVDHIHERHPISLVGFATGTRLIFDNEHATPKKREKLKAKIDKLRTFERGTTNLAAAIRRGMKTVEESRADARVLVILSDGGADNVKQAFKQGARATEAGIQLFAVGIGEDYEADRLLKLVTPSNGAVFGDADLGGIKSAFSSLIGRIEGFVVTKARLLVRLGEGVRPRALYKTRPEQAFVADLAKSTETSVEVLAGNLERGQTYAFLLSVFAPPGEGTLLVARAKVTYDIPALGLRKQALEVALTAMYADEARESDGEIRGVYRRARIARLVEALAEARRREDQAACVEHVELLVRLYDEQGDGRMKAFYEQMLAELERGTAIANKDLNEVVLAATEERDEVSTAPAQVKQLYDVVLVSAKGSEIALIRALRDLTGKDLRELSSLIDRAPTAIMEAISELQATELHKKLEPSGATIAVRPR